MLITQVGYCPHAQIVAAAAAAAADIAARAKRKLAQLFEGFDTMQSFINQKIQNHVINSITDCLSCNAQLVGGDQQIRPHEEGGNRCVDGDLAHSTCSTFL